MSETVTPPRPAPRAETLHVDVLIAGAGISGIGAAYHLATQCPEKSFLMLDALESFGGTWLIHNYPGVRSDSDLFTFGYRFKPWMGAPIATRAEILKYLGEVITENHLDAKIRYRHRIISACWDSAAALWTLHGTNLNTGGAFTVTTNFLWMCQGYYRHSEGYTPHWRGMENFRGRIVHPQTWPADLDYRGKRVVLIGSGATAATMVPAMARDCASMTVLQRSPTYFWPGENANELVDMLRVLQIDPAWIHEIARRKILFEQQLLALRSEAEPEAVKQELIGTIRGLLPPGYDVETHFTPRYRPWQQRLAFVPQGDLFHGISAGAATMVTDEIDHFTETGIVTKSGRALPADIVISATGFNICPLGDITFTVDGTAVDFSRTITYRGMMFTGMPNLLWIMGYFRASWTLRVDLLGDFVCRLLRHMAAHGARSVTVQVPPEDAGMELLPGIDPENFNPGYLMRAQHIMPRRGANPVWAHTQDYWKEREEIPAIDLAAPEFIYH